ncbi:HAD family hydrolase [Alkalicoccobacillus porphyridii]|uniref:HAD family hydrolase n=1 Tax=Alkalicoccobacillus porphyridii TaxID=2597270 RepID=A0A554A417_9BACI|nr:HAD family hydrolase [Alkalicoccobacillus porphyridii]TSB48444.1 HAD family hydrolase [Alkalicoccobacillus porphyridii]
MRNAILFDLDQTLLDKDLSLKQFARHQYDSFSLHDYTELEPFVIEFVKQHHQVQSKETVYGKLIDTFLMDRTLLSPLVAHLDQHFPAACIGIPGLIECLQTLKRNQYKIGIITNGRDSFQRENIKELGILHLVDNIVTSQDFGRKKPDLSIFLHGLGNLQATPQQAIFVGDSLTKDIVPSKTLGMKTILMGPAQVHPDIDTSCSDLYQVLSEIKILSK